jgi:hypothetical protein
MSGVELALIGGIGGAILNKEDPLKGALMGAGLGFGGASLLGGAAAGATGAGAAGAAGSAGTLGANTYAAMVPGLTAAGPGSQAAALAAQTGEFGLAGLTATGSAAATPGTLSSAAWNMANKAMLPGTAGIKEPLQLARMGLNQGGGTQNRTVYSPPQMRAAQQNVDVASGVQGLLNMRDPQDARRRRMASLSLI